VTPGHAQDQPKLRVHKLPAEFRLDGVLNEAVWQQADKTRGFATTVPKEGGQPTGATTVQVLADADTLVLGIRCDDPDPSGIVSFAVGRDAYLSSEDNVRIVLGTFLDGRTGYVFAVNPNAARYDAVVAGRGEYEDRDWDGIWEAKTSRDSTGWSIEIRIPALSLSFRDGLREWHFNVSRHIQRRLESSRWASPKRDYKLTQTSRAGLLVGLPAFSLGLGISAKPSGVIRFGREAADQASGLGTDGSLDLRWRPTSDLTAAVSFNTDFAETDVDTRRTNLTRFPLLFPEKRSFFNEGSEIFDFGLGSSREIKPFHSRRIGLVNGRQVPIRAAGKLTGRIGDTSVGVITAQTKDEDGVAPRTSMGVVRLKQDVLAESSVGIVATAGDPLDRDGSWLAGTDFTYQTSEMFGNRNFLVGVWGMTMDRDGLAPSTGSLSGSNRSAWGGKIDYPNDLWDTVFVYRRIGEDFDPSLGFVRRKGVHRYYGGTTYAPRPDNEWIRQMHHRVSFSYFTNLDHEWESYGAYITPLSINFESGEELDFNLRSYGERIEDAFEIADDIEIPVGKYDWTRYGVKFETASKRVVRGEIGFQFGPFYSGYLKTYEGNIRWNVNPLLGLRLSAEYNEGSIPEGEFTEDAYSFSFDLKFSPDLTLRNYVQYDTDSKALGSNTRLHWTATPKSNMFLVFNYNGRRQFGDLQTETYDTILKIQHEFRF